MAIANLGYNGDTNEFIVRTTNGCGGMALDASTFTTQLYNHSIITLNEAVAAQELQKKGESPRDILAALRHKNTEELKDMLIKIREYKP